jgi:hypothetical protein
MQIKELHRSSILAGRRHIIRANPHECCVSKPKQACIPPNVPPVLSTCPISDCFGEAPVIHRSSWKQPARMPRDGYVRPTLSPSTGLRTCTTNETYYLASVKVAGRVRLEGLEAKKPDSPYRPGKRSTDWVKVMRKGGGRRSDCGARVTPLAWSAPPKGRQR